MTGELMACSFVRSFKENHAFFPRERSEPIDTLHVIERNVGVRHDFYLGGQTAFFSADKDGLS